MNFHFTTGKKQNRIPSTVCPKSFLQRNNFEGFPVKQNCSMGFYLTGCSCPLKTDGWTKKGKFTFIFHRNRFHA